MTAVMKIFTIIAVVLLHTELYLTESVTICSCNVKHADCINNTCKTGWKCLRQIEMYSHNNTIKRNDQFCDYSPHAPGDAAGCAVTSPHRDDNGIVSFLLCCRGTDYCNANNATLEEYLRDNGLSVTDETPSGAGNTSTDPNVNPTVTERDDTHITVIVCLIIALFVIVLALVATIMAGMMCKKCCYKRGQRISDLTNILDPNGTLTLSGSGAGVHQLENRTIARQIQLVQSIGKGRYGEVFLGKWQSQYVAVKIFSTIDEQSWKREGNIYRTCMLNNENILRFIAMDNKDTGVWTQLWMVFDYHPRGSLYDFLSRNVIKKEDLCKLTVSLASGLEYLHHEFKAGESHKPAIAHRDLKSRNILVKTNGTCCIADFGLAVSHDTSKDMVEIINNTKQGTKRYMAPEVLDETMDATQFVSFKLADIYSLGLVLWETTRRCEVSGGAEEYQLPYANRVPHDPTIEEMKKIVSIEEYRPPIPNNWISDEELSAVAKIMQECWYCNPSARLTALRVKKSLQGIWSKGSSDWKPQAITTDIL